MDELNMLEGEANMEDTNAWESSIVGPGPTGPVATQPTTLPTMPVVLPSMPVAPVHEPAQEEDPFADLEASMAI